MKPRVALVLLTYEPEGRPRGTAKRVLQAALDHLQYSGDLQVHIADDGSAPGHAEELCFIAGSSGKVVAVTTTNAERGGYGRSYNLATHVTHDACEVILPLEDDWLLQRDLDLDPLVATLMLDVGAATIPPIRCVRMGYLGWTQGLRGECVHTPGGAMLLLDPASAERHVFSGHPRLETRDFQRAVGLWPEGRPAGETEFEVSGRDVSRLGVAWPLDLGPASMRGDSLFAHIGSVSLNQLDPKEAASGE